MQLVSTTPIALLICLAILYSGPARGVVFLFLTMPLGAAAAFNLSGLGSITVTDAAVMAIWAALLTERLRPGAVLGSLRPGQPGLALLLLMVVATLGAVFLPRLHAGATEVFVIQRRDGASELALATLGPVGSNIGQLVRLTIAASVFLALATLFRRGGSPDQVVLALIGATCLNAALAVADLSSSLIERDPIAFLRTSYVNVLDNQFLIGIRRLIGAFPEPSSFAYYTIGLFGFWLRYWFGARGSRLAALMLVLCILLLLRSTSSAAWLGLAVFSMLFLLWQARAAARNRRAALLYLTLTAMLPVCIGGAMLAYTLVPVVSELLDRLLLTKLSSASGIERMTWNLQALRNFVETYAMGAGLGSVRASGWVFATLGSLGIVGSALYLWFVVHVLAMRPPRSARVTHDALVAAALQTGCAALLLQACLTKSFPNLETPFFAMAGLAVGLIRRRQLDARAGVAPEIAGIARAAP